MRFLFLKLLVLTGFVLLYTAPAQAQKALIHNPELVGAKADTLLQQAVEMGEHVGITGGIYADGKIMWTGGAGFRDREAQAAANAKMVHRIASISKPMTAVAILQLLEQGKIDLDNPVQTYVPEFPKKPQGDITVRQLLTHTSGIRHYKNDKDGGSFEEYPDLLSAMARFKDRDLAGTPGEVYQYTTYGYVVLGVVIEKVSGMEYEAYMKQYVWGPAGMKNTSVEHENMAIDNKSALYKITDKGKLKVDYPTNLSMKVPGGGIQSTAEDLLLFGKAILENSLIKKETLDLMLQDPGLKGSGNPYGMGWFIYGEEGGKRDGFIGHSGAQAGTSTQLMVMLDKKVVVSVISNTRGSWPLLFRISYQMMDLAISEKERNKPVWKVVDMSSKDLDRFVGTYDFGKDQLLKISRKGNQLYSQMNTYPTVKVYPGAKNKVFYRHDGVWFEFEFGEDGEIAKTTYWQGEQAFFPKKVD